MQHDPLERLPPLRHDQQAMGRPAGRERLLNRPASGDELFQVGLEQVGREWP
jgi:hypothetical protein